MNAFEVLDIKKEKSSHLKVKIMIFRSVGFVDWFVGLKIKDLPNSR